MNLQRQSKISFVVALALMPVGVVAIFFGILATGGGHGSYWLFFLALALCVLAGCILAYSVVTGFIVARNDLRQAPWLVVSIPLLVGALALGLWGMQG
jgi:hypothetical protein